MLGPDEAFESLMTVYKLGMTKVSHVGKTRELRCIECSAGVQYKLDTAWVCDLREEFVCKSCSDDHTLAHT